MKASRSPLLKVSTIARTASSGLCTAMRHLLHRESV
jgi:hypothetical protein